MISHLGKSVFDRWNAAGLDDSIATLYRGDRESSPEGSDLPRAEYGLPDDTQTARSRGHRILEQMVRFQIWTTTETAANNARDGIEEAFVNAEVASSNPMTVPASAGSIMSVDYQSSSVFQEEDGVWRAVVQLTIQYSKPERIPA